MADPGFAKGVGADHGERAEREPKRGYRLEALPRVGSSGRATGGVRGRSHPEAERFLSIFIQKSGQKLRI